MAELTPMMKQYMQIKAQHQDCILFFRLGDFYEMFCEDAKLAAKELELTLTTRDRGKAESEQTPMCGVPFHSAEGYIARLVAKGYKVAICEQTEDPATAKGLVSRDITRVVTPGAVTESSMLEERRNNYFASLFAEGSCWGLCFCDVSTGAIYATELDGDGSCDRVLSELARFSPAEALLGGDAGACQEVLTLLQDRLGSCIDPERAEFFEPGAARQAVQAQFAPAPQALLEPANVRALRACGALLLTLRQVQRLDLRHINTLEFYTTDRFMQLDPAAWRNLEITQTLRAKEKRGSLLWVLDHTKTAMGGRLLHSWLEKPLLNPAAIQKRLNAVEELTQQTVRREELILALRPVTDFERLMARIVTGSANCRDLVALAGGCRALPEVLQQLEGVNAALLQQLAQALDPLTDLCQRIDRAIVDDPPFSLREGGMIRPGYSEEVDQLRDIMSGGTGTLTAIEAREKEKTGIRNLRVGYNRVFGYYIEVSKGQTDLVPETYIRKQTLVNCERYITQELKDLENTILSAKDRICALEYNIFTELRQYLADQAARVQATAQAVAQLDVLSCFAALAVKHRYTKPTVDLASQIEILDGRHPVVEQVLKGSLFVPNDTRLGLQGSQVAIITGPNMAGKSTYMRQVALIVLLAQIGCFVPARSAHIGVVDRLFTRIGASDDLAAGQSTFMVEMTEVADILRNATPRSLLILDEIGRGTSTFDGMAIARAVLEYAADPKRLGAKTLFATHYHELTAIERELPNVKNYNIAVKKRQGDIIFLRKIVPGAADESYGVEVAKLAGLPEVVITRARALLRQLEQQQPAPQQPAQSAPDDGQLGLQDLAASAIRQRLEAAAPETMTPIEALNFIFELKQLL